MSDNSEHRRTVARRIRRRILRYIALSIFGYAITIAALYRDASNGAPGYYVFGTVFLGLWAIAFYHDVRAQRHYQGSGHAERGRFGPGYWRRPWALSARMEDPPSAIAFHQLCLRTVVLANMWGFLITLLMLISETI